MIKNIVTNEMLDNALQNLIVKPEFYYPQAQEYFMDMYNTGCRSTELLFPELWNINDDHAVLKTLKTGVLRYIQVNKLSTDFVECIRENIRPYAGLSHYQLEAEYKKHFELSNLHCGKKATQLYSFRYNRARIAYSELNDLSEVMSLMGWQNPEIAKGYINNTLNLR